MYRDMNLTGTRCPRLGSVTRLGAAVLGIKPTFAVKPIFFCL